MSRLGIFADDQRLRAKAFIRVNEVLSRQPVDPVTKMALYHPAFFGEPLFELAHEVLRRQSYWTFAEREHLAVVCSRLNECPFCVRVHTEIGRFEANGGDGLRPEVSAAATMLERLNRDPEGFGPADVAELRAADVPDAAIADVLAIGFLFDCINRVINALGFAWETERQTRLGARIMQLAKYRLPAFLLRERTP